MTSIQDIDDSIYEKPQLIALQLPLNANIRLPFHIFLFDDEKDIKSVLLPIINCELTLYNVKVNFFQIYSFLVFHFIFFFGPIFLKIIGLISSNVFFFSSVMAIFCSNYARIEVVQILFAIERNNASNASSYQQWYRYWN